MARSAAAVAPALSGGREDGLNLTLASSELMAKDAQTRFLLTCKAYGG